MKEKAILSNSIGEFYWEMFRFVPYVIYTKLHKYKDFNPKLIVLTRQDRFDIYSNYADILVPLGIIGDNTKYIQNSFRLDNFPQEDYKKLLSDFRGIFESQYDIIEMIYPDISKSMFSKKDQFSQKQMIFDYLPRIENSILVENFLPKDKKIVILASRFRQGIPKRNWSNWQELYDMIWDSKLRDKYNFVICGKFPDYISDKYRRFLDINSIKQISNSSLSGILIEVIKRSFLTVGSQSAIPNISLLFGVEVLEWGHQKHLHTIEYNIKNTKVTFLEDFEYKISSKIIFDTMSSILLQKEKECQLIF